MKYLSEAFSSGRIDSRNAQSQARPRRLWRSLFNRAERIHREFQP